MKLAVLQLNIYYYIKYWNEFSDVSKIIMINWTEKIFYTSIVNMKQLYTCTLYSNKIL